MADFAERLQTSIEEPLREYSAALSKASVTLIAGIMVPSVGLKYLNTGTNPFKEYGATMPVFIHATVVHLIFAFLMRYLNHLPSRILSFCIWFVSGILTIELLLFILFTPIWWIPVINMSVALLIVPICFLEKLKSFLSVLLGNFRSHERQEPADPNIEMMEIDPPAH